RGHTASRLLGLGKRDGDAAVVGTPARNACAHARGTRRASAAPNLRPAGATRTATRSSGMAALRVTDALPPGATHPAMGARPPAGRGSAKVAPLPLPGGPE